MLSLGFTKRQMFLIHAIENLIKITMAYIISSVYMIYYTSIVDKEYEKIVPMTILPHLLIIVIVYLISMLPICYWIKSKSVINLVKGLNNDRT